MSTVAAANLHQRWAGLKPPLRPKAVVVSALRGSRNFARTSWPATAQDHEYAGQRDIFNLPTRREITAALPPTVSTPRFIVSGNYELAER